MSPGRSAAIALKAPDAVIRVEKANRDTAKRLAMCGILIVPQINDYSGNLAKVLRKLGTNKAIQRRACHVD